MEEEEWDENDISEFTRLVEQQEQTWKLAAEDIQLKKELKISTLITSEQRIKIITLLQEYSDVFA